MSHFFNVCKTTDIPLGEARMFVVNELFIGVFNVAGKFLAIDDHGPHAGASLAHGIVEGDIVRCRIHHWRFCIRSGTYLDEAKPQFNAQPYSVRVVGDQVQIELESESI